MKMFLSRSKCCWSYVIIMCLLCHVNSQEHSLQHFYFYPGDIILGGLFPIHFYDDAHCGDINPFRGVQSLVSVIFALNKVNEILEPSIGKRLGMVAMDTCYITDRALESSLNFAENRYNEKTLLKSSGNGPRTSENFQFTDQIIGVLGPTASGDSVKVATLLKLFKIPQISFFSTSPELSDNTLFPYFLRTVPSDLYQAKAITSVLRYFGWSYVSLIYEDTSYGRDIAEVLKELAGKNDVCIGFQQQVSSSDDLESIASSLLKHSNTNNGIVVLLNARYNLATRIIRAVNHVIGQQESSKLRNIQWVTSDGLTGLKVPSNPMSDVDSKILGITLSNQKLPGFIPYFESFVREKVNGSDPWFRAYWEFKFNCSFNNSSVSRVNCTGEEDFVGDKEVTEYETLYNGRNAVYTYGQALLSAFNASCEEPRTPCEAFSDILKNGQKLLHYLKNVSDPLNVSFSFINKTDGPAHYSIMSFQNDSWITIGNFTGEQGLSLDMLSRPIQDAAHGVSTCSMECPVGQYREKKKDNECCWECVKCRIDTYVNTSDPYKCTLCPKESLISTTGNFCQPIGILSFSYSDPLPVFLSIISAVGILGALFTFIVFITHRKSPIVKASSIGTSSLLLFGIILSFTFPFVAMAQPTVVSCAFTRIFLGLSYTVGYSAIFAKLFLLNRIFRALRVSNSRKNIPIRRNTMLPLHALMLAFVLIGAHALFILSWIAIGTPRVQIIDTSNDGVPGRLRVCNDARGLSYIAGLLWSFGLMIACCVFAVKLRKLPKAFNERISILYCTSISVILWTVFVPIYSSSEDNYLRIISMCFSLFFHGALLLLTMFGPKVYIILLKPERNTRESVVGFYTISLSSKTDGLKDSRKDAQTQTSVEES